MNDFIRNARNRFDYFLRERLTLGRPVSKGNSAELSRDQSIREEMLDFISAFDWDRHLAPIKSEPVRIVDIGCRNFCLAPLWHSFFDPRVTLSRIDGIEVDAYRRYRDLRTRANYGAHYAASIPNGFFHAKNFLDWQDHFEIGFLLNPFVTKGPLLSWGLPLSHFDPEKIYAHARRLCRGLLFVSHPTEEELEIGIELAKHAGFTILEQRTWHPTSASTQQRPRFGLLLGTRAWV